MPRWYLVLAIEALLQPYESLLLLHVLKLHALSKRLEFVQKNI